MEQTKAAGRAPAGGPLKTGRPQRSSTREILKGRNKVTRPDLDDDFQSLHFLVRGPGVLQRLVELLDAVHVILLSQVQQLLLGALRVEGTRCRLEGNGSDPGWWLSSAL